MQILHNIPDDLDDASDIDRYLPDLSEVSNVVSYFVRWLVYFFAFSGSGEGTACA